nr:MFS transporter [Yoonia maritima]
MILVPITVAALIWQWIALPSLPAQKRLRFSALREVLSRPYFFRAMAAATFTWGSAFTMFTYLRPFLEQITGVGVNSLSLLLLVLGCAGFLGTWLAGRLVRQNVERLLKLPPLVMGLMTAGLMILGSNVIATAIFMFVWGAMNTAMSVIWMTWMTQNMDDAPEAAGSMMVASIQTAILLGAVIGGALLDSISIYATFLGSIFLALLALALVGNGKSLLKP